MAKFLDPSEPPRLAVSVCLLTVALVIVKRVTG